jgi:hypothetical protein
MNRIVFGVKNVYDKMLKIVKNPSSFTFYVNTFVLSKFRPAETDIYIVSYPKCGRTWVRITLRKYLELAGYRDLFTRDANLVKLPGENILKFDHDTGTWIPAPPRIDQLHFNNSKYKGKKVCFIARNPCDVLVSCWYHLKYREKIYSRELKEFIRDNTLGIHKIVAFMNMWIEHMNVPEEFYLMTYEDLRRDPESQFRRLFEFIGLAVNASALNSAIEETSFEKMRHMERKGDLSEPWMRAGYDKSEKSMKVRAGRVGGYKEELTPEDIEYLHTIINTTLSRKLPYGSDH